MTVRLTWSPQTVADSQKIYRSSSAFDSSSLPSVLATIDASDFQYEDDTAPFEATAYYMVETVAGGQSVFSSLVEVYNGPDTSGAPPPPVVPLDFYVGGGATTGGSTFSAIDIGSEPSVGDRRFVVVALAVNTSSGTTPTVTVNGVSASLVVTGAGGGAFPQRSYLFLAEVNSGTSVDVAIGAVGGQKGMQAYTLTVGSDYSVVAFNDDFDQQVLPLNLSLNTDAGKNVAIVMAAVRNSEGTPAASFTGTLGITTDYRADYLTNENIYVGSAELEDAASGLTAQMNVSGISGDSSAAGAVFVPQLD